MGGDGVYRQLASIRRDLALRTEGTGEFNARMQDLRALRELELRVQDPDAILRDDKNVSLTVCSSLASI
jgi:hypothetical protein